MKPQDIFEQIITIENCHEACSELFMFEGTTVVELPNVPLGTKVLASFMLDTGICQLDLNIEKVDENDTVEDDDVEFLPTQETLGKFAMKLTLEPITE